MCLVEIEKAPKVLFVFHRNCNMELFRNFLLCFGPSLNLVNNCHAAAQSSFFSSPYWTAVIAYESESVLRLLWIMLLLDTSI